MASIYFYYNELLRHSADQGVMNDKNTHDAGHEGLRQQQEHNSSEKRHQELSNNPGQMKSNAVENQDEGKGLAAPYRLHLDTEAMLIALQPRMNRLAYLPTAVGTNLDAFVRSLGPKL